MDLRQRMALTFALFSATALVFNTLTPANPYYSINIIEESCLTMVFMFTWFLPLRVAQAVQVVALLFIAFFPLGFLDSPFFGAVICVFSMVLIYAYGGYKTFAIPKLFGTFFGLLSMCLFSLVSIEGFSFSICVRAFMWTLFISVFLFVLWLIIDDINKRFYSEKEEKLIRLNRELLEINKKLIHGGCEDGPI